VRGSAGLKFPSDESEKGSLRIDTDSSTTARVDPEETLKTEGATLGAAAPVMKAPQTITRALALIPEKILHKADARIFI
jgi:hypothetical protein